VIYIFCTRDELVYDPKELTQYESDLWPLSFTISTSCVESKQMTNLNVF